jgi:hypothetical protein
MKKLLLFITILLIASIGYSQAKKSFNIEKYVIQVTNEDDEVYFSCLEYLYHNHNIKIYAVCENNFLIGFRATYKSYSKIEEVLMYEFPDMVFFRKDISSIETECEK